MTEDNKKAAFWTGGITTLVVLAAVALWFAGVFDVTPVQ